METLKCYAILCICKFSGAKIQSYYLILQGASQLPKCSEHALVVQVLSEMNTEQVHMEGIPGIHMAPNLGS